MDSFLSLAANSLYIVGIVKKYNTATREVAVFIPKFMPIVPENREDIQEMTNYGNNTLNSSIQYSSKVTKSSYIWAMAKNVDEKMPKIGSKVLLTFMEGDIESLYWEPFNPNGDYQVLDDEKYDNLISFQLGNLSTQLSEEDSLRVQLPDDFDCTMRSDDSKTKTFKINYTNTAKASVQNIYKIIGNTTYVTKVNGRYKTIKPTGLIAKIEALEKLVGSESTISSMESLKLSDGDTVPANAYIKNSDDTYSPVDEGSEYDATKEYYLAVKTEASGILEALSLVDAALGYASSGRETDTPITQRVETLEDRIPVPPSDAGNYVLKCSVGEDKSVKYTWEKE